MSPTYPVYSSVTSSSSSAHHSESNIAALTVWSALKHLNLTTFPSLSLLLHVFIHSSPLSLSVSRSVSLSLCLFLIPSFFAPPSLLLTSALASLLARSSGAKNAASPTHQSAARGRERGRETQRVRERERERERETESQRERERECGIRGSCCSLYH